MKKKQKTSRLTGQVFDQQTKPSGDEYPCVKHYMDKAGKPIVVLFHNKSSGIVIASNDQVNHVGVHSFKWSERAFTPFYGKIKIEQRMNHV